MPARRRSPNPVLTAPDVGQLLLRYRARTAPAVRRTAGQRPTARTFLGVHVLPDARRTSKQARVSAQEPRLVGFSAGQRPRRTAGPARRRLPARRRISPSGGRRAVPAGPESLRGAAERAGGRRSRRRSGTGPARGARSEPVPRRAARAPARGGLHARRRVDWTRPGRIRRRYGLLQRIGVESVGEDPSRHSTDAVTRGRFNRMS